VLLCFDETFERMLYGRLTSCSQPPFPQRAATAAGEVGPSNGARLDNCLKCRRRPQKRKASARGHVDDSLEPRPKADCVCAPPSPLPGHSSAPCVLDWTWQMMRAEEDLFRAVVVSVISDCSSMPGDEITELVAPWLEEEPTSLVLRRLRPCVFLLFLPRPEQVQRLVDRRPLLWAATFAISCSCWTRFASSTG
jgi:hypothetical protein